MTLLFIDGFDHYTTVTDKWINDSSHTVDIHANYARHGTGGMRCVPDSSPAYARRAVTAYHTYISGGAFKFTAAVASLTAGHGLIQFVEGSIRHISVTVDDNQKLRVYVKDAVQPTIGPRIALNAWYYLELKAKIDDSAGLYDVRLNGESVLSASGIDTNHAGTNVITTVRYGTPYAPQTYWDDVYICDDQGSTNNTFLGDVKVETIFPTGVGNSAQFTRGGTDSGANWSQVDEAAANGDTDYNSSSTAAQIDSFAMGNLTTASGSVYGVQTVLQARKDDAGTQNVQPHFRIGTTNYARTSVSLGNSHLLYTAIEELNPDDSAAWEIADINGLEFGYKNG